MGAIAATSLIHSTSHGVTETVAAQGVKPEGAGIGAKIGTGLGCVVLFVLCIAIVWTIRGMWEDLEKKREKW